MRTTRAMQALFGSQIALLFLNQDPGYFVIAMIEYSALSRTKIWLQIWIGFWPRTYLLSKAHTLKEHPEWKKVFIKPDLTRNQRDFIPKLDEELASVAESRDAELKKGKIGSGPFVARVQSVTWPR